jgi:hypothetical protein
MKPTRGERNNNPGNIDRNATKWQGMSVDQSGDVRFVVFSEPVWGIRALAKVLLSYSKKFAPGTARDIDTVREIVNRWAPPVENNTDAYVNTVARALGVGADEHIVVEDAATLDALTKAIIAHENGRCRYPDDLIARAVDKALEA